MKFTFILVLPGILLTGCEQRPQPLQGDPSTFQFPLTKIVPATAAPFEVNPSQDYRIEFGRGSGWHGLDTVAFGRDGAVTLHRMTAHGWETAALTFSRDALARILAEIRAQKIMHMAAGYHADVQDGTQWVFWLTQGDRSKSIYFNNHFPPAIQKLAQALDTELRMADYSSTYWKKVPPAQEREHEKPLWESIRR